MATRRGLPRALQGRRGRANTPKLQQPLSLLEKREPRPSIYLSALKNDQITARQSGDGSSGRGQAGQRERDRGNGNFEGKGRRRVTDEVVFKTSGALPAANRRAPRGSQAGTQARSDISIGIPLVSHPLARCGLGRPPLSRHFPQIPARPPAEGARALRRPITRHQI